MKPDFDTILDECIRRVEAGEDLAACLADYPEFSDELEPLLNLVQEMHALPAPQGSPTAALAGQERMLAKLDDAQESQTSLWESWIAMFALISQSLTNIFSKENFMYRKTFVAVALVLVILFAGTTLTAYAAQGSLPGDALYGVKTAIEDIQMNTAWDTADEAEKSIQYAERRIQEISELITRSRYEDIPVGVERFEHHLLEALSALSVVAQNDPEMAGQLALILIQLLDEQYQVIASLMESNPDANPMALNEALRAASSSMEDVGSVVGLDDDNDNANMNENIDDDDNMNEDNDNANENDDDGNDNDGDGNDNDDDGNDNDDDGNDNDDDGNDNDDDGNDNDDDGNDNDDDGNDNDDDGNDND